MTPSECSAARTDALGTRTAGADTQRNMTGNETSNLHVPYSAVAIIRDISKQKIRDCLFFS